VAQGYENRKTHKIDLEKRKIAMGIVKSVYEKILENVESAVIGRSESVRLAVLALLARGHVLLEDVPGSGKTLLAKSVAASVGSVAESEVSDAVGGSDGFHDLGNEVLPQKQCKFKRIQFTPDMLPSDITGINFFNMKTAEFEFMPGPVFANIVLADEVNRATPKTQAGLLECMEERQVTIDTETRELPPPFMVIATQNPIDTQGVFPLPEAQLDRFMFKVAMQYTSHADTVKILQAHGGGAQRRGDSSSSELAVGAVLLRPVVTVEEVLAAQEAVPQVFVHEEVMGYIVSLAEATRAHAGVMLGVSARGALVLMRGAQAVAAVEGRDFVIPDDVKQVAVGVMAHRLILKGAERVKKNAAEEIIAEILGSVTVPTEFLNN